MKTVNFGIDLGTTNSLITKYENGKVIIFKNPVGHKEGLASVVAFRKDRVLIGDKAREYVLKDPVNVFSSFKRRIGTDDKFYIVNQDENITPLELSAHILRELKQFVHTGETVKSSVITIPASFDTMQSNATKKAGQLAGFEEVFLLQEPIAASLAYFNSNSSEALEGRWLVYDLGGGTFDVALVEVTDGEMRIKDHEGNNFLGGVDFDQLIIDQLIVPEIIKQTGITELEEQISINHGPYEKLFYELLYKAEEAKKELSVQTQSEIELNISVNNTDFDIYITITREQFNQLIQKNIDDTISMLDNILKRNGLSSIDIKEIILVGGSTIIPYVREQLGEKTSIKVNFNIDPTTAVAVGAAFYAAGKYYTSNEDINDYDLDRISDETNLPEIKIAYSNMSRELEEVLLIKTEGEYEGFSYRIVRNDGGFDTGIVPLKSKFTVFLPLLSGLANDFSLKIYDQQGNVVNGLTNKISILQGQYNINGQPLPKDICIEVDDKENNTTKLEVIFERNSILPLKKTLYREISKTIKKGSNDGIIINILEGDQYARAISNLTIGCIEISGNDITSDLLQGSDIEIQVSISDSRELTTEVFLVMTQQEFKNVFSISEKHISIPRLKEQFFALEEEFRKTIKSFSYQDQDVWMIYAEKLYSDLVAHKKDLTKLKDNDKSDKKYIIAEAISRLSQEYDKIGGNDRLEKLQVEYMQAKERALRNINAADYDKELLKEKLKKLEMTESRVLCSRNPAILSRAIETMDELDWDARWCSGSQIVVYFLYLKNIEQDGYENYRSAKNLFALGDKAMEAANYIELKRIVSALFGLLKHTATNQQILDFKGTGIG
jgi:molecular chaperone DnaK